MASNPSVYKRRLLLRCELCICILLFWRVAVQRPKDFLGGFCATVWCPICLHWEETCRIESAASLDGLQRVRPKLRDHSPGQFSRFGMPPSMEDLERFIDGYFYSCAMEDPSYEKPSKKRKNYSATNTNDLATTDVSMFR
ncbi:uncharacterized protein LOC144059497 [Vanacampus margaritifer]